MKPLTLGFSPCPNDTFIFAALVNSWCSQREPEFAEPLLEDVETLNRWAFKRRLAVTKLSFHALGHLLDDYCALSVGGALGRGCGPLLVASGNRTLDTITGGRVAVPGVYTTAALLFSLFLPTGVETVEMRFDRIMPAVAAGEVDAGVIIHESRFTYRQHGLTCLQDLGAWWEETTGLPIPLGCIAARRTLPEQTLAGIEERIRESLLFARRDPQRCRDYIRRHAQETEESVIDNHIGLYVNDYSLDPGAVGRAAVEEFFRRGRSCGALPAGTSSPFCRG
jgi:1,4-dihydroxy-6-naphthoate synthase